jgi:hypothetical protein
LVVRMSAMKVQPLPVHRPVNRRPGTRVHSCVDYTFLLAAVVLGWVVLQAARVVRVALVARVARSAARVAMLVR